MRLFVIVLSLVLAVYALLSISLGLGEPGVNSAKWCALALCPEEFSEAKAILLIRESRERDPDATNELRRAVVQEPASAYAWADLAEGLMNANRREEAKTCMLRAVAAGPKSPAIRLRAANLAFQQGNNSGVLTNLRSVLQDPDLTAYYDTIFWTYLRTGLPVSELLNQGVPAIRGVGESFLRYLIRVKQVNGTEETWAWLLRHNLSDDRIAANYVGFLLQQKQEIQAAETWKSLNSREEPRFRESNWVYNGGFERERKPALLDWQLDATPEVSVERENATVNEGKWALSLSFTGNTNTDFHGLWQEVVLPPGRWTARAAIKTEGITTDEGIRLRVADQGFDLQTDSLVGTHDWTVVEQGFTIGQKDSGVVRLEIERRASRRFDNKIAGKAWIDAVEIRPSA
jgi:tetratricopeptide (TPR) repeat protein